MCYGVPVARHHVGKGNSLLPMGHAREHVSTLCQSLYAPKSGICVNLVLSRTKRMRTISSMRMTITPAHGLVADDHTSQAAASSHARCQELRVVAAKTMSSIIASVDRRQRALLSWFPGHVAVARRHSASMLLGTSPVVLRLWLVAERFVRDAVQAAENVVDYIHGLGGASAVGGKVAPVKKLLMLERDVVHRDLGVVNTQTLRLRTRALRHLLHQSVLCAVGQYGVKSQGEDSRSINGMHRVHDLVPITDWAQRDRLVEGLEIELLRILVEEGVVSESGGDACAKQGTPRLSTTSDSGGSYVVDNAEGDDVVNDAPSPVPYYAPGASMRDLLDTVARKKGTVERGGLASVSKAKGGQLLLDQKWKKKPVDIVIEVRDARFPQSSACDMVGSMLAMRRMSQGPLGDAGYDVSESAGELVSVAASDGTDIECERRAMNAGLEQSMANATSPRPVFHIVCLNKSDMCDPETLEWHVGQLANTAPFCGGRRESSIEGIVSSKGNGIIFWNKAEDRARAIASPEDVRTVVVCTSTTDRRAVDGHASQGRNANYEDAGTVLPSVVSLGS